MDKISIGIVGFGKQGSLYAGLLTKYPYLFSSGVVTSICDIDESKREEVKRLYPDVKFYQDYNQMFKEGKIDVVFIETPHYLHPEIAIAAFKSGINVLLDKPSGVFTKAVKQMNDEKTKHPELLFGMMFNQRTDPLYRKAKEITASKEFGQIIRLNWLVTDWYRSEAYYAQGGWRGTYNGEGGGVLLNQAPHQLDILTWICGVPASVVAVMSTKERHIYVENDVTAIMEFKNGASGTFIASTHDAPGTNRLQIDGEGGKIVIENRILTYYKNKIPEPEFNKINKEFWGKPEVDVITYNYPAFYEKDDCPPDEKEKKEFITNPPQHLGIIKNYLDVLKGKSKKLIAPGEEGINSLTLSNAIYLSAWINKKVDIPFEEEEFIRLLDKKKQEEKANFKKGN